MKAIQQMTLEHERIGTVVRALEAEAATLAAGGDPDTKKLHQAIEFFRVYADDRHHQREEVVFFPALIRRGVPPQGCPLGGLSNGHGTGRELISRLEMQLTTCGDRTEGCRDELRQTLEEIVKFYRHHLWMEDEMVFPMAERFLTEDDDRAMMEEFEKLDRRIGRETVERLDRFAGSLA